MFDLGEDQDECADEQQQLNEAKETLDKVTEQQTLQKDEIKARRKAAQDVATAAQQEAEAEEPEQTSKLKRAREESEGTQKKLVEQEQLFNEATDKAAAMKAKLTDAEQKRDQNEKSSKQEMEHLEHKQSSLQDKVVDLESQSSEVQQVLSEASESARHVGWRAR